ncbi:leucine-rich repeat domain-containing protein [Muribaculum sp.]|uniref:leucine-rich repeat domain-containing protein n=1 Tax=Muribaculum sp. TaxID=1918611 RepID=UPI0023C8F071|nr:leucine-rich repeat domain-containing protein [Muribaculum sp.]MDE5706024.1 leucine-rich repeat domain-containing protein [Muribaculum sp.]
MKRFYSLSLAALCTVCSMAAPQTVTTLPLPQRHHELKSNKIEYTESVRKVSRAADDASTTAPESIVGMRFVTTYNDTEDNYNGFFTVSEGTDGGIVLNDFAEGYSVNATYDASTGKISIPTGVVIGTHSTYGDITLYALTPDASQYSSQDITGTVSGDKVTFDNGVYGKVDAGGLVIMSKIEATKANANITYSLSTSDGGSATFENPLLISKPTETSLKIVGLSGILYGAYYEVPVSLNSAANSATITAGTTVDCYYYYNRVYSLYGKNPVGMADDLTMSVVTSETTSLLKADDLLYCYVNGMNLSGYAFSDIKIDVDFNVFTGEATGEGDDNQETDTPSISGINYLLDRENNTATVTGCIATVTTLDIPASITVGDKNYAVTSVAEKAFINNKVVTSISIPSSITTIGTDAFRNMSGIKTVYIADLAAWCAVELANGNANPIYNAFPTSTSKWGKVYFNGKETTTLEIPEGVTTIGRSFYGFKGLTSATLPSSLLEIGDQAFSNCTNLTEIEIPANVSKMGSSFFGCSGLTKVTLKGGVANFRSSTFYGCKALESINLPEGVETIGMMVFSGCSALKSVSLPSTLTEIGMMAFDSCNGLTEIRSTATVPPTAASMAFDGVPTDIPVYVPANSINDYKAASEWKEFTNYQPVGNTSGIESIEAADNTEAVYYNLNGVRVDNPTSGLYIKRQGNTAVKVLVK